MAHRVKLWEAARPSLDQPDPLDPLDLLVLPNLCSRPLLHPKRQIRPHSLSPSASEASSRLSLETRLSEGGSFFSTSRLRLAGAGHTRQKSSQAVQVHPTIKEEPSVAALRAQASPYASTEGKGKTITQPPQVVKVRSWYADGQEDEDEEVLQQMKKWSELQHEANYECRRGKMLWEDPRSNSFMGEISLNPHTTIGSSDTPSRRVLSAKDCTGYHGLPS